MIRKLIQRLRRPSTPVRVERSRDIPGDSPEDWRAGDLAECISDGGWFNELGHAPSAAPQRGEVRIVTGTREGFGRRFLTFARFGTDGFDALYFRKVKPSAETQLEGECEPLDMPAPSLPPAD